MTEDDRRILRMHRTLFDFDVSDEQRDILLEAVRRVDPRGHGHLVRSRCAYEFHMIIDSIIGRDDP